MSVIVEAAGARIRAAERQALAAAEAIEAVICVPTYRRPAMLGQTLASLVAQRTRRPFRVVVVDNEAKAREGLAVAEATFEERQLKGVALLQPLQGNCHAINAALAAALATYPDARYLMMIDDDEIADPDWLEQMVAAADRTGADVVGGPVHSLFDAAPAPAIAAHPVFYPAFDRTGPVPMIYGSGNFLIRTASLRRLPEPSFHVSFNHLGGGDTDFFTRCRRAGMVFHWNNEATIHETVPIDRQNVGWILRRGLRIGAINFRIDRRNAATTLDALRIHGKNAALLPVSLWRTARALVRTRSLLAASHPTMIAVGRLLASIGVEPHQYRAPRGP
jgi:glycosyltransferase involved in cell wall biosynthesis